MSSCNHHELCENNPQFVRQELLVWVVSKLQRASPLFLNGCEVVELPLPALMSALIRFGGAIVP